MLEQAHLTTYVETTIQNYVHGKYKTTDCEVWNMSQEDIKTIAATIATDKYIQTQTQQLILTAIKEKLNIEIR